jgi:CheY-like chemotaxis protein
VRTPCTLAEALDVLRADSLACVVSDPAWPGTLACELQPLFAQASWSERRVPIFVRARRALPGAGEDAWQAQRGGTALRGAASDEHLLALVASALHWKEADLSAAQREILHRAADRAPALGGRKVLVVDDDVRNIFALTAVLEHHGVQVLFTENGRDAWLELQHEEQIELVLMDVMMPEMDGYGAMRQIRSDPRYARLPVIALTARAMKGDREKCLEAGASDYIAKPVDPDRLVSLLRIWLLD